MEIVVVGCRGFGKVHLSAIKGMDISIVERNRDAVEFCKANYDIRNVYGSLEEALSSSAEIIDLVTPHNLHGEMSVAAMKRGKNVLVEKPISTVLSEGEHMISESRKNGVKFMVAEQFFFDPAVRRARELIDAGAVGKVHSIIVRSQGSPLGTGVLGPDAWRYSSGNMGGGALIDGGIHFIETLLDLGGEYSAVNGTSFRSRDFIEGEDTTHAVFSFRNGSAGLFFYSWAYRNPPRLPGFEIIGDSGSIYEDSSSSFSGTPGRNGRRTAYGDLVVNGVKEQTVDADIIEMEITGFRKAVEEGTDVPYPPENALRNLRAVLEIYGKA